jgi:hypothetical protein
LVYLVRSEAQRVRISSTVLFRRRDCAGGAGPAVDAPGADAPGPVAAGAVVAGAAAEVVVGAWEADDADVVPRPGNKLDAG